MEMINMRTLLVAALLVGAAMEGTEAYSAGAPKGACDALEPVGHTGARRNPTVNPFSLSAPLKAAAGDIVTVTLATQPGQEFKGYIIQAVSPSGQVVGQFQSSSVDCNGPQDTATHSNPNKEFMTFANMTWKVPASSGQVYFRGTVVRDYSNYFINIYSNPLVIS